MNIAGASFASPHLPAAPCRAKPQLNEVANLFARAGLAVETASLRNQAPEPLVPPSLAPAFAHAAVPKPTD